MMAFNNNEYLSIKYLKALIFFCLFTIAFIDCQHQDFIHDVKTDQKPWSHERFHNNPDHFQFVIVSDRTGGHRPGVFPNAARKLNLLNPEFVISIGDLIEGYTKDREKLLKQWNEINSFVSCFDMPFFYLPGNHDISNKETAMLWEELFGKSYYYFIYKDVLFLCLNSEETSGYVQNRSSRHLSDTQIGWTKDVIKRHPDVNWICVFLHQPLWIYDEGYIGAHGKEIQPKNTGFQEVEKALSGKNYTVFAGHFHSYTKSVRNSRKYFILSTTGGGSALRGLTYGEFDHGVWVTMTENGPVIANLLIDGIADEDVITKTRREEIGKSDLFLMNNPFVPGHHKNEILLNLKNQFQHPLEYSIIWPEDSWKILPRKTSGTIDPGETRQLAFGVEGKGEVLYSYPQCHVRYTAGDELDCDAKVDVIDTIRRLFPQIRVASTAHPPVIDGILDDSIWKKTTIYNEFRTKHGGKVTVDTQVMLAYDPDNLYIAFNCVEPNPDRIKASVKKHDGQVWEDDSVQIFLDTNNDRKTYYRLIINSAGVTYDSLGRDKTCELFPLTETSRRNGGWTVENAIPWDNLDMKEPRAEKVCGFAIVRSRTQNSEIQQLPPLYGRNNNIGMFGTMQFE